MLKVLYLPLNTPDSTQSGMIDAWKSVNVELHIFDYYIRYLSCKNATLVRQEFLNQVINLKPDLVHMQLQFTGVLDFDVLNQAKKICPNTIFINWSGDLRKHAPTEFVGLSKAIDYSLVSNIGQIELYKQAGCHNCLYWQIGYDPKICFPQQISDKKYDVSFAGNMYSFDTFPDCKLRLNAVQAIKNKFNNRAGIFGNGYPSTMGKISSLQGLQTNMAYCESKTVLSISNFNDVSHYFSDRLLACLASGRPTICYRFPGIESYFADRSDLFIANSIEHILELINFCVKNPDIANEVGLNGYKKVRAEHTYYSRVIELLQMLNLINKI